MKKSVQCLSFLIVSLILVLAACSIGPDDMDNDAPLSRAVVTFSEGFEKCSATGTTYATGNFAGNNLTWYYVQTAWAGGVITGSKTQFSAKVVALSPKSTPLPAPELAPSPSSIKKPTPLLSA